MKSGRQIFERLVTSWRHIGTRFHLIPTIPAGYRKSDRGGPLAKRHFAQNLVVNGILFILLFPFPATTLRAQCFAEVELNRKSVYVQQSFRVTITVYTSTWFTAPLEFGNLQIPNAFIVPFEKSVPGVFTVGNKKYSGIQC